MVHRRTLIAVGLSVLVVTGCSTKEPPRLPPPSGPSELEKTRIRMQLQSDIMGVPAKVNQPADLALIDRLFPAPSVNETRGAQVAERPDTEIRLFTRSPQPLSRVVGAIAKTLGYTATLSPEVPDIAIDVPTRATDIERLTRLAETASGTVIWVDHESRYILVLPESR